MTKFITVYDYNNSTHAINVEDILRIKDLGRYPDKVRINLRDGTEIEAFKRFSDLMAEINSTSLVDKIISAAETWGDQIEASRSGYGPQEYEDSKNPKTFAKILRGVVNG